MSQNVDQGLERLVHMALDYYRAPALYAEAMAREAIVPEDLVGLFRLSGGADPDDLGLALTRPQDRSDARLAARFYIEQVLFRADADHYRLLGLTRMASEAEIKEHHRLLIRLTHPDRGDASDAWRDIHAGRINRAYNTLRDPETRATYDSKLAAAAHPAGEVSATAGSTTRMVRPAWHRTQDAYPAANRRGTSRAPIFIMSGVALVAGAFVFSVYYANRPVSETPYSVLDRSEPGQIKPDTRLNSEQAAVLPEEPPLVLSAELQARLDAMLFQQAPPARESSTAEATGNGRRDGPAKAVPLPRPISASGSAPGAKTPRVNVSEHGALGGGSGMSTPPPPTVPASEPQGAGTLLYAKTGGVAMQLSQNVTESHAPVPAKEAVPQPAAQTVASQPAAIKVADESENKLTAYDLGRLFSRMAAYYERGDLNNFMMLFDDGARAEVGGKRQIRQDYDNLFRVSDSRRLEIGHVNWSGGGDTFIGKVPYRAMVKNKGDEHARMSTGLLYMEVIKRGGEARITALFYTVGDRS